MLIEFFNELSENSWTWTLYVYFWMVIYKWSGYQNIYLNCWKKGDYTDFYIRWKVFKKGLSRFGVVLQCPEDFHNSLAHKVYTVTGGHTQTRLTVIYMYTCTVPNGRFTLDNPDFRGSIRSWNSFILYYPLKGTEKLINVHNVEISLNPN